MFDFRKMKRNGKEMENVEKQGAHGPHRSPEKTVQINKHI